MLPKSVLREIDRKCRSLLWLGKESSSKSLISWEIVCRPKRKGGLGVNDLMSWNIAAVGKKVCDIITTKNSLWAHWIIKHKLKRMSYWGLRKPLDCSWNWGHLLIIRCFDYVLGNGTSFSFWHDPWFHGKAVSDAFSTLHIPDTDISKWATVSYVWRQGRWCLPDPIDDENEVAW